MRTNREQLLQALELVAVAASKRDEQGLRQGSCLVFHDGKVSAFNGEIACSSASPLNGVRGAVRASGFLDCLRKLPDAELDVSGEADVLCVLGKGRRARFALEREIHLPISRIEPAAGWAPLDCDEFPDAAKATASCAGKDEGQFDRTCVQVCPEHLESYDGTQMMRWRLKTPVKEPALVRREALRQAASLGATEVCLTPGWLHFRNPAGDLVCARRYVELPFPDLTPHLKKSGHPVQFPRGLADAAARAEAFSRENKDENYLCVTLTPGRLHLAGRGVTAEYEEVKKVGYDGPTLRFAVSAAVLGEIAKNHASAYVTPGRILVDGDRWRYAALLGVLPGAER